MLRKLLEESKLSLEEEQQELAKLKIMLQKKYPYFPVNAIDEKTYIKLLPIIKIPYPTTPKSKILKLLIAFGDTAIEYLERYQNQHPMTDVKKLIDEACKFELPTEQYDVSVWQGIMIHQQPNDPSDIIMRILPFAKKIEDYVKSNKNALLEEIRQEIARKYEHRFGLQYDSLEQDKLSAAVEINKKIIKKEIQAHLEKHLREQLKLPQSELNQEQRDLLIYRMKNLTPADIKRRDEMKETLEKQHKERHENRIKLNQFSVANKSKQDFIAENLKQSEGLINAEVDHQAKKLLSSSTSLSVIRSYARHVYFTQAEKNLTAAEVFFNYRLDELSFNLYLQLKPKDDSILIPDIMLDGSKIDPKYSNYYLKKINPQDPRAAILGKMTSCCQSLGDLQGGEEPTIYGITDARSGFYVLCKRGASIDIPDKIVAQGLAWRSEKGHIIIDSVECEVNFKKSNEVMISDFYRYLADELINKYQVAQVLVGANSRTAVNLGMAIPTKCELPVGYSGNRDSYHQNILADVNLPIVQFYLAKIGLYSGTINVNKISFDQGAIKKWCDICLNNNIDETTCIACIKSFIAEYKLHIEINEGEIKQHFMLAKKFLSLLNEIDQCDRKSIDTFNRIYPEIDLLIKKGVNVNLRNDKKDNMIVFIAANVGRYDLVRYLIEHGSDVNAKDRTGTTLLWLAYDYKKWDEVTWLLQHGVDINSLDRNRNTLLVCSVHDKEKVKWLLENGANIYANSNTNGEKFLSKLTEAIRNNFNDGFEIMKWVIEKLPDINTTDWVEYKNRYTALHIAVMADNMDMVTWLVGKGADVNIQGQNGNTPLHLAILLADNLAIVKLLIANGADINIRNNAGKCAKDLTASKDIREFLLRLETEKTDAFFKDSNASFFNTPSTYQVSGTDKPGTVNVNVNKPK